MIVRSWLIAMYGSMKLVTRKTDPDGARAARSGCRRVRCSASPVATPTRWARSPRSLTRAVGALLAYLVIAGIVLRTSLELGLVVLLTAPLLVILAMPLLRPLERRQELERTRGCRT